MSTNEQENGYTIPGLKVLLLGSTGTGKTHSIATLIAAGVTPCIIFTEPGMSTMGKVLADQGIDPEKCHWKYIASASQDFASMIAMSKNLNSMSFEMITKLSDPKRNQHAQWIEVLKTCENFVDDRSGASLGNVSSWGTDKCLVIDSLSGLNDMSMALIVGARPTRSMSDWMVAQNNLLGFLNKLCVDLNCHFILTGHMERETDEVSGGIQLMASTLGKKLAPKLSRNFDEVVMCKRTGEKFHWTTNESNADLKSRCLPISNAIAPDFGIAISGWKKAGGVISGADS